MYNDVVRTYMHIYTYIYIAVRKEYRRYLCTEIYLELESMIRRIQTPPLGQCCWTAITMAWQRLLCQFLPNFHHWTPPPASHSTPPRYCKSVSSRPLIFQPIRDRNIPTSVLLSSPPVWMLEITEGREGWCFCQLGTPNTASIWLTRQKLYSYAGLYFWCLSGAQTQQPPRFIAKAPTTLQEHLDLSKLLLQAPHLLCKNHCCMLLERGGVKKQGSQQPGRGELIEKARGQPAPSKNFVTIELLHVGPTMVKELLQQAAVAPHNLKDP